MRIMILFVSLVLFSYSAKALTDVEKRTLETALYGTLSVEYYAQRQRGELVGCGFEFAVGVPDWLYKAGGLVVINGSLNFYSYPGKAAAYALKIQPADITIMDDGSLQKDIVAVDFGYFMFGKHTTANKEISSFQCERGGYCAAFDIFPNHDMVAAVRIGLMANQWKVAYTRESGVSDVTAKIDLGSSPNGEPMPAVMQYLDCEVEALKAALNRLQ